MTDSKPKFVNYAFAIVVGIVSTPLLANASPVPIDQAKVQSLAAQVETSLQAAGCVSTFQQERAVIQSVIAASGQSPAVVEAALGAVEAWGGLCPSAAAAVANVDNTIEFAMAGYPAVPASQGGPGNGGTPIGSPAVFFSGGGTSNYQVP